MYGVAVFAAIATMSFVTTFKGSAFADAPQTVKDKATRPMRKEFTPPVADPALPNVLLIGDSISIAYTLGVREQLAGRANVYRPPINCGPTTRGVTMIDRWLGDTRWDVIHFNFGLHDLKYMGPDGSNLADPDNANSAVQVPIDAYRRNLDQIVRRLNQTDATIIWRPTTPVPKGARGRVPGDAAKYNRVALEVMRQYPNVQTDPFDNHAASIASLQKSADVHYTPQGARAQAEHVARVIAEALKPSVPPKSETNR